MNPPPSAMLYSLQIGRGLAAMAVIFQHSAIATRTLFALPAFYSTLFDLGYVGVDYFFVLSGFIIMHAISRMPWDAMAARRYAMARIIRVYLPYWPVALALIAVLWLLPSLSMSMGARDAFSWSSSIGLLPVNTRPVLWSAWTLQHEIVFYLLVGICVFAFKRPALIFLWAMPIGIAVWCGGPRWVGIVAGLSNMEFLFGVAAYMLYHRRIFFAARYMLLGLGVMVLGAVCVLVFHQVAFAHYTTVCAFAFALIMLGLVYIEQQADFSKRRGLIFLGNASYSLYLVHGLVNPVLVRVFGVLPHWYIAYPLFVVISSLVSIGYYLLVEKPLTGFGRKKLASLRGGHE